MKLSGSWFFVMLIAGTALGLAACTPAASPGVPSRQPSDTTVASTQTPDSSVTRSADAVACAGSNMTFGQTCEDQGHVQYTIGAPTQFTPSQGIQPSANASYAVKMTVTVYNGSDAIWDPGVFVISCTPGDGGPVIDAQSDVGWHDVDSDADQIPPGQGKTATVGCWTMDAASVQVSAGSGNLAGGVGHWAG